MKKILITGASGFIGRQCLPLLVERGYEVHALALEPLAEHANDVIWHCQNFLDEEKTKRLVESLQPSHCLHLAWYTEPGRYWSSSENLFWTASSISLLYSFYQGGGERFVGAGSCAEYSWSNGRCSEHLTPLVPATLYGTCKHTLQEILASFSVATSMSSAWGRIFFLYGPHEHPARLVPTVINSLLQNKSPFLSHGDQIRDFIHVSDAAGAFVSLLDSKVAGPLNIASDIPISIKDLVLKIADRLNGRDKLVFGARPTPEDEPALLTADISRLQNEVGFLPTYNLETGLDQTILWWKNHNKQSS